MKEVEEFLRNELVQREKEGRKRRTQDPFGPATVDFASNDYLGYAREKVLERRILERSGSFGGRCLNGSTGSRLLSGHQILIEEIEDRISAFHRAPAGLIFNSGYDLNLGFFSCVLKEDDVLIYDEYIHASVRDGARLGRASRFSFRHNDMNHLETRLLKISNDFHKNKSSQFKKRKVMVAMESLYSMDGDLGALKTAADLCDRYGAALVVDEAHATAVYGPRGEGLVYENGLEDRVFARIHTFGKGLGVHGAILLGSQALKEFMINYSHPFIYSTALPPSSYIAIDEAYKWMKEDGVGREKLRANITFFNEQKGHGVGPVGLSPIFPVWATEEEGPDPLHRELLENNLVVFPVKSPTVPKGKERLRVCLHAFNTTEEIEKLAGLIWKK